MNARAIDGLMPVAAALAATSLLLPWSRSGTNDRSTIELLRTASVLDVVSASTRWLLVGAWYLIVVLAALSILAVGWGHVRLAAALAAPLGPAMLVAAAIVQRSPLPLRWGVAVGCATGLTASARSAVILIRNEFRAGDRAT
jgi:hypothetical protein